MMGVAKFLAPLLASACVFSAGCASLHPTTETPSARTPPPSPVYRDVLPKVGIALGGGGARGFAEVGVLRVLEEEKIPIDLVVGTSVGSLIGAFYADTGSARNLEAIALSVEESDIFDYGLLSVFSGGFIKGERMERLLQSRMRHKTIETLPVPFTAVAVDLRTGAPIGFERGSVARAVHASSAIPGVFVPVEIGGHTYVDGGVASLVPTDFARRKGAEVLIAVSISPALPATAPSTPLEIAFHAVTIMSANIGRLCSADADVTIHPDVGNVAYDDFSQKRRLMEAGAQAARTALPAIRAAIAAKTKRMTVQ